MAEIKFENVSKSFGKTTVIENMNLTLPDGKFTVLLGPSGCGKTTLLRMIAGIGPESSGTVYMNGKDLKNVPPGERDIAMVFQSYALYPTMSVRENIEFCLKNNKIPKAERKKRVEAVAKRVDLTDYLDRKPSQLSGGQRQRVALARAMVKEPQVFLMDEPLSNLDAKLRASMRSELIQLHNKLKTTFIYVTHDQIESMAMADYIVLLNHGKIMQQDTPEEIYNNPANVFTAQFIGTPATNILPLHNGCYGFRPEKAYFISKDAANFEQYWKKGTILTREMLGSEGYLMVSPAMILMLIFVFYPLVNLVYLSFFNYNLIGTKEFVGLKNYKILFFIKTDFIQALRNTGVYTLTVVIFSLLLAILLALWLEKDNWINRFLQKSMFTPYLISMVSCAYIWSWMYDSDSGVFNALLNALKLSPLRWLNDSDMAIFCVAAVAVWKSLGYYLIIVLASIKTVPRDILEAAELDRTPPLRKFIKITLPMISPQLFFLLITITISSFKVFDVVRVMTNGGPGNSTDVLVTYIYRYAFQMNAKVGYASAAGTVLLIIMMILTYLYFKVLNKRIYYQ